MDTFMGSGEKREEKEQRERERADVMGQANTGQGPRLDGRRR